MHSLYIITTTLSNKHINNIAQSTSRHRIYVVHPSVGLCPPTSSSSLLVFNLLTLICSCAQIHRAQLRSGQVICAQRTRSTFPKIRSRHRANSSIAQSTYIQHLCTKKLTKHLHLAMQALNTFLHKSNQIYFLHRLATYLYHYKNA
jgi:hypothetical protein